MTIEVSVAQDDTSLSEFAEQLTVSEFDDPARYDLEYGSSGVDLPFYRALANAADGQVLDVACGTGRVALALAADGRSVTAVDVNEGMLARARAKDGAEDPIWVEQDARSLQLRAKFDLALIAGNAFQQFLTNDDRDAVLRAVYRQLKPGGQLVLALRFPQPVELAREGAVPAYWHTYTDSDGYEVLVSGTSHFDPVRQVMEHEIYRHWAATGIPVAAPSTSKLRYHYPQELEAALKAARFEVVERFGDFDGSPLQADSTSMVFVCRKPRATRRSA